MPILYGISPNRKDDGLMVQRERLIKEFMELVQIDSETKHEQLISLELKKRFAALGLKLEEDEAAAATRSWRQQSVRQAGSDCRRGRSRYLLHFAYGYGDAGPRH